MRHNPRTPFLYVVVVAIKQDIHTVLQAHAKRRLHRVRPAPRPRVGDLEQLVRVRHSRHSLDELDKVHLAVFIRG